MKSPQLFLALVVVSGWMAGHSIAVNPAAEETKPAKPLPEAIIAPRLEQVAQLMRQSKYSQAMALLNQMEKEGLPSSPINNMRGAMATQQRKFGPARVAFARALEAAQSDQDREHAMFNLAEIDFVEKKFPAAYKGFNQLLKGAKTAETKGLLQYKLCICELQQGQEEAAQQRIALMPASSPQRDYSSVAQARNAGQTTTAQRKLDAAVKAHGQKVAGLYCDALIEMGWLNDGKISVSR
jgi:predicted negative regulator of RcsB-dependent stress response